jgi:hypothetical protein
MSYNWESMRSSIKYAQPVRRIIPIGSTSDRKQMGLDAPKLPKVRKAW